MIERGVPVNERPYWATPADELLVRLETKPEGLRAEEAQHRQACHASIRLKPHQDIHPLSALLSQFRSPIILILLFAATVISIDPTCSKISDRKAEDYTEAVRV